ncbi:MAG: dihydroneopterin aldolase [Bacteroidales bacterium]|nr:dihydroneopterin aldolase [Bacteroidales bacterium]MDD2426324.1 dihydroneopterin aldolase [Bacteroidales bacterium]MDD3988911.1 dihydroneopterin aldolase [Bacteroidales bacterium]MDD4638629.1 dihydroneopterin aldolase [Bacteroidales bacterium]
MTIDTTVKGEVELLNMEFYSYHGHFEEEQIIGNKFLVSFSAQADVITPGKSDELKDALNYQEVYSLISREMAIPSKLLENVAFRILSSFKERFPTIESATISISKLNPPVGGKVEAARVVMSL